MGTDARNTVGLKLIQLSSDTYVIQHQCLLSPMKTVRIGEDMLIVYPNTVDPVIFYAKLLELWQKGDVLFLKLWNYNHNKEDLYTQDLTTEDSLFSFVSMPFISRLAKAFPDISMLESRMLNIQNRNNQGKSLTESTTLTDKPELPRPFYDSSGKMVMKYISESEIILDLPFIFTQNKRLKLNMPYLKTENKLSGNDITAVRILDFKAPDSIVQLRIQELKTKCIYTIDWNMDYAGGYWLWNLSDFETILDITQKRRKKI